MGLGKIAKRIRITLVLAGLAILLHTAADQLPCCTLSFDEFSGLEAYRLLACHFTHWSTEHLLWDLAVFVILGAVCEWRSPGRHAATLLLSAAGIPLCIMVWLPQIDSYRGLSGIDTALFGLLAADLLIEKIKDRDVISTIVFGLFLVGLFAKITMEMMSNANIFVSDTSFTPVPLSHVVGAIIGLAVGAFVSRSAPTMGVESGTCASLSI